MVKETHHFAKIMKIFPELAEAIIRRLEYVKVSVPSFDNDSEFLSMNPTLKATTPNTVLNSVRKESKRPPSFFQSLFQGRSKWLANLNSLCVVPLRRICVFTKEEDSSH